MKNISYKKKNWMIVFILAFLLIGILALLLFIFNNKGTDYKENIGGANIELQKSDIEAAKEKISIAVENAKNTYYEENYQDRKQNEKNIELVVSENILRFDGEECGSAKISVKMENNSEDSNRYNYICKIIIKTSDYSVNGYIKKEGTNKGSLEWEDIEMN